MKQRIWTLTVFFLRHMFTSLTGLLYLILSLVYWYIFFPPDQGTPDFDNYVLIIGGLGAALSFLIALSLAARANEARRATLGVREGGSHGISRQSVLWYDAACRSGPHRGHQRPSWAQAADGRSTRQLERNGQHADGVVP
jgi:hypothetical protein